MPIIAPGTAHLVALKSGLAPHAEALDCDDVRGPRSLFGESALLPRPIGNWPPAGGPLSRAAQRLFGGGGCCLLWEGKSALSPEERARRIRQEGEGVCPAAGTTAARPLAVPAPVYLAGRSASTFSLAWTLFENGLLPEWGAVLASCQTDGRGRMRRVWHSPRGNLYVSFLLPRGSVLRGDAASLAVGWLFASALRAMGFPIFLKWPNDLLYNEQGKIGGILLEERDGVLMAGVGINLAEAPAVRMLREEGTPPAAVLLPLEGAGGQASAWDRGDAGDGADEPLAPFPLWRRLVSEAILAYTRLVAESEPQALFAAIEGLLAWKGRAVTIQDYGEAEFSGRLLGLGPGGGVALRREDGHAREFFSGSLLLTS